MYIFNSVRINAVNMLNFSNMLGFLNFIFIHPSIFQSLSALVTRIRSQDARNKKQDKKGNTGNL